MRRIYLLAIAIFTILAFTNCERYDDYNEMMLLRSNANNIQAAVAELYPQARVVEMDQDRKTIEVDIIDNDIRRDVYFDLSLRWLRTVTDIHRDALPAEATNRLATKYDSWFIDNVKQVDTPTGNYYLVELDKGERDKTVKIDAAGNIL